jgi:hypothetical protein
MSYYDDIRSALEVALASIPDLPPIAWENRNFSPTTGTGYIQVRQLPTARRPAVRGLNPPMRYQGVFQLLVKVPENKGPSQGEDIVETLLGTFLATTDLSFTNTDTETVYVTIDYAEQVGAFNDSPWYTLPVNIGWYSYK